MESGKNIFEELEKAFRQAGNVADGARKEVESVVQLQINEMINSMNLVKKDEFDALSAVVHEQNKMIEAMNHKLTEMMPTNPDDSTSTDSPDIA